MLTHTTVTIARTRTSAMSRSHGRRVTLRGDRLCRGGSPCPEASERSIDALGESGLAALEQWQARPGRNDHFPCRLHAVHRTTHAAMLLARPRSTTGFGTLTSCRP